MVIDLTERLAARANKHSKGQSQTTEDNNSAPVVTLSPRQAVNKGVASKGYAPLVRSIEATASIKLLFETLPPSTARAMAAELLALADQTEAHAEIAEGRLWLLDARGAKRTARLVPERARNRVTVELDCQKLSLSLKTGKVLSAPSGFRGWRMHPAALSELLRVTERSR